MGFVEHDPYATPGQWITTVVNNRANRIPRSRVFASISWLAKKIRDRLPR